MPRVVCHLRNAGHLIQGMNGPVRFAPLASGGMLSEQISDEDAAYFLTIRGYGPHVMPPMTDAAERKASLGHRAAALHKDT